MDDLDEPTGRIRGLHNRIDSLSADLSEDLRMLKHNITAVRYGLSETGGFVRFSFINAEMMKQMEVRERANYLRWKGIHELSQNTDANEGGSQSSVPVSDDPGSNQQMLQKRNNMLEALRTLINVVLSRERFEEAAELQNTVVKLLDNESFRPA